jgi:hypothetical protein
VGSVYQFQIIIPVTRLTHTAPINPPPTIILDILAVGLIWDGVFTRVNITTITTNVGVTIGQITITKAIEIDITEATSVVTTISTRGIINTKAIGDVSGEGKLIARIMSVS